jgi:bla regulator protein blaR1
MTPTAFLPLLANHLWQSTVFTLLAGVLTLALRKNRAQARYWVWLIASLKFLIPLSLLVSIGGVFSWRTAPPTSSRPSVSVVIEQVAQPFTAAESSGASVFGVPEKTPQPSPYVLLTLGAAVWVLGCGLVLASWSSRWKSAWAQRLVFVAEGREMQVLRRLEERIGTRFPLAIAVSPGAVEPSVLGLFRPVLVWPAGLSERLRDEELEAIVLHELSHVRRLDNLTAAMNMAVQAVFWFHPMTWWIGARLSEERENACDQDVLGWGGASHPYAEGILKVCEFCLEAPLACVSGISGSGSTLKRRIESILSERIVHGLSWTTRGLLAFMALAVLAAPIAWGVVQATLPGLETRRETLSVIRTLTAPVAEAPAPAEPVRRAQGPLQAQRVTQNPQETSPAFEVVSIRPNSGVPTAGARGAGPGARGGGPAGPSPCGGIAQVNPGRFVATNVSLYRLINLAAGRNCRLVMEQNLLSGLPDWAQSAAFDIQATVPAGTPAYTTQQLLNGEAPQLQMMIQNMLADRFQLALHRETKEIPIYNLVMVKMGKIKLSDDQTPPPPPSPPTGPPTPGEPPPFPRGAFNVGVDPPAGIVRIRASSIPISTVINFIQGGVGRMVVDKTDLKGLYDIPEVSLNVGPYEITPGAVTVWPEILLQLGLRMEATRGPVEMQVIDRASRPTEN